MSDLTLPSHFPSFSKLDSYDSSMDEFIYKCKNKYDIPPMVFDLGQPSPILPPETSPFHNFTFPELEWDDNSIETSIRRRFPKQL